MRDISQKVSSLRTAIAKAVLKVNPTTIKTIKAGKLPKGNPLEVARVAAIQAAKNTSSIIPFCHPLPVEFVGVEFHLDQDLVEIVTTVKAIYKTGVEMEALTAASVAALTIYDMAKPIDETMQIESVTLIRKTGGKSDFVAEVPTGMRAGVIVISDTCASGKKKDVSGELIVERLKKEGIEVVEKVVVPDEEGHIAPAIRKFSDDLKVEMVITTGGTGVSPRDNTPQVLAKLIDRDLPGVAETIRSFGQDRNPFSMLSRAVSGIRRGTLILSFPGSRGGVRDSLDAVFPAILHTFKMLAGEDHPDAEHDPLRTWMNMPAGGKDHAH